MKKVKLAPGDFVVIRFINPTRFKSDFYDARDEEAALQRFRAFEKLWGGREGIVSHPNMFERSYPWVRFEWGCVVESEKHRAVFGSDELEATDA